MASGSRSRMPLGERRPNRVTIRPPNSSGCTATGGQETKALPSLQGRERDPVVPPCFRRARLAAYGGGTYSTVTGWSSGGRATAPTAQGCLRRRGPGDAPHHGPPGPAAPLLEDCPPLLPLLATALP